MHMDELTLAAYDFSLPEERIATHPSQRREDARLLVCRRKDDALQDHTIAELPELLPPNAVIVVNNSKVVPARISGKKPSGGRVETLLLTPVPLLEQAAIDVGDGWKQAEASVLLKAARRPKPGQRIEYADSLRATMQEEGSHGMAQVILEWKRPLATILENIGALPLPPYLQRDAQPSDAARYQTIYADASKAGSVAAPTAGLHLTEDMKQAMVHRGMDWVEATLHVGYGTFSPVRTERITDHDMHSEFVELSDAAAAVLLEARQKGRPIVAIGTTSCRVLEGIWEVRGCLEAFTGWTNIFLYPGKPLNVVDHLVTNFHLPKSTLFMLVCAFAGTEFMHAAYAHAIRKDYRFYSYGDAMCIL